MDSIKVGSIVNVKDFSYAVSYTKDQLTTKKRKCNDTGDKFRVLAMDLSEADLPVENYSSYYCKKEKEVNNVILLHLETEGLFITQKCFLRSVPFSCPTCGQIIE